MGASGRRRFADFRQLRAASRRDDASGLPFPRAEPLSTNAEKTAEIQLSAFAGCGHQTISEALLQFRPIKTRAPFGLRVGHSVRTHWLSRPSPQNDNAWDVSRCKLCRSEE